MGLRPSNSDTATLDHAQKIADKHHSGGTYNMAAVARKGSDIRVGVNDLYRPASTVVDLYRDVCGIHAELDLYRQWGNLAGFTVYIAGTLDASGSRMLNTAPCCQCIAILNAMNVRHVVFNRDGLPEKFLVRDILDMVFYQKEYE